MMSENQPRRIVIDSRHRNIDLDGQLFKDSTVRSWSNFEVNLPELIPNVYKIQLMDAFFPYNPATLAHPLVNIRIRPNGNLPTGTTLNTESALPTGTISTDIYKASQSYVYDGVLCTTRVQSVFYVGGAGTAIGCFQDASKQLPLNSLEFSHSGKLKLNSLRVELFSVNSTKPTASSLYFQQPSYLVGGTVTDATNPYEESVNCVLVLLIYSTDRQYR